MSFQLDRVQVVSAPLDEVSEFFENPRNLERITPPFLNFRILTPGEIEMKTGALIDYSIALHGVPMKWKTLIEEYVPKKRFVDVQLKGPYTRWHHTHSFRAVPGGTEIKDTVRYELPFGPLGVLAHALFVRRQLRAIFDYRHRVTEERFGKV